MINELIEQIGRERLEQIEKSASSNANETVSMARVLLAVLDAPQSICIQEAWEAAGGNPGIVASREELISTLKQMDEVIDDDDTPPAASVPDGWKLVPLEPTIEMREAYHQAEEDFQECCGTSPDSHWAAMLAAAPAPGGE